MIRALRLKGGTIVHRIDRRTRILRANELIEVEANDETYESSDSAATTPSRRAGDPGPDPSELRHGDDDRLLR